MEGKIIVAWLLFCILLRVLGRLEYYFFGGSYNKPYYLKNVSYFNCSSIAIFQVGLLIIGSYALVLLAQWWFK